MKFYKCIGDPTCDIIVSANGCLDADYFTFVSAPLRLMKPSSFIVPEDIRISSTSWTRVNDSELVYGHVRTHIHECSTIDVAKCREHG